MLLSVTGACRHLAPEIDSSPALIVLSIDGFRHDFRQRGDTPNLDALARRGVAADRLQPVFPTKTFPNHFTIVTGVYPDRHGLVANNMYDPVFDATYRLSDRNEVGDGRWYDAEPIWVAAERHGIKTAPVFWPGSEAEISGIRPTYWQRFDGSLTDVQRVDRLLDLLDLPAASRPRLLTLYFNTIDDVAHRYGPDPSPELRHAVEAVDRVLGRLLSGLEARQLASHADLIVLSDHGMTANSRERLVLVDRYIDIDVANPVDWDPVLALWPQPDDQEDIFRSLVAAHPRLTVYRRKEIPRELHYGSHRRVPPIVAIADDGWAITTSARAAGCQKCFTGGSHGYDPRVESMGGLFIAAGPSFRVGVELPRLENIHLYELMCAILDLDPAPNDGDRTAVLPLLRSPARTND